MARGNPSGVGGQAGVVSFTPDFSSLSGTVDSINQMRKDFQTRQDEGREQMLQAMDIGTYWNIFHSHFQQQSDALAQQAAQWMNDNGGKNPWASTEAGAMAIQTGYAKLKKDATITNSLQQDYEKLIARIEDPNNKDRFTKESVQEVYNWVGTLTADQIANGTFTLPQLELKDPKRSLAVMQKGYVSEVFGNSKERDQYYNSESILAIETDQSEMGIDFNQQMTNAYQNNLSDADRSYYDNLAATTGLQNGYQAFIASSLESLAVGEEDIRAQIQEKANTIPLTSYQTIDGTKYKVTEGFTAQEGLEIARDIARGHLVGKESLVMDGWRKGLYGKNLTDPDDIFNAAIEYYAHQIRWTRKEGEELNPLAAVYARAATGGGSGGGFDPGASASFWIDDATSGLVEPMKVAWNSLSGVTLPNGLQIDEAVVISEGMVVLEATGTAEQFDSILAIIKETIDLPSIENDEDRATAQAIVESMARMREQWGKTSGAIRYSIPIDVTNTGMIRSRWLNLLIQRNKNLRTQYNYHLSDPTGWQAEYGDADYGDFQPNWDYVPLSTRIKQSQDEAAEAGEAIENKNIPLDPVEAEEAIKEADEEGLNIPGG